MVALVSSNINPKSAATSRSGASPTRPPLLPSDPDNALAPRRREVASSLAAARRCPSPVVSRTPAVNRPHSTERRRAATHRWSSKLDLKIEDGGGGGEVSAAQKMLMTSARSLSVSFQGESFSPQVSKVKQTPSSRPERRRSVGQPIAMNAIVDFSGERRKMSRSGNVVNLLPVDDRSSCDEGLSSNSSCAEFEKVIEVVSETNGPTVAFDHHDASDTESVSSGSSSELRDYGVGSGGNGRRAPRGIMVPARFWQETNNRLRRRPETSLPTSKNNGPKSADSPSLVRPRKLVNDNTSSSPRLSSCTRGQSSPVRGPARPASPSKLTMTAIFSPTRGMSPSHVKNRVSGIVSNNLSNTPSILSFSVRGKIGESRIGDAHQLRLLYNRAMQWRIVNARAESSFSVQKLNAEKSLYTAWVSTSKLRESVRVKRIELQMLKQNLKLTSILKGQMAFLEDWALIDPNYSTSLLGAIEALRASTLRLPVVNGARVDIVKVKDAISSAVDVMQAMGSSVCLLLPKVDEVHSLVSELANVSAKERGSLNQCKHLLSMVASMEVTDCSLRTHILQQNCPPSSSTVQK